MIVVINGSYGLRYNQNGRVREHHVTLARSTELLFKMNLNTWWTFKPYTCFWVDQLDSLLARTDQIV